MVPGPFRPPAPRGRAGRARPSTEEGRGDGRELRRRRDDLRHGQARRAADGAGPEAHVARVSFRRGPRHKKRRDGALQDGAKDALQHGVTPDGDALAKQSGGALGAVELFAPRRAPGQNRLRQGVRPRPRRRGPRGARERAAASLQVDAAASQDGRRGGPAAEARDRRPVPAGAAAALLVPRAAVEGPLRARPRRARAGVGVESQGRLVQVVAESPDAAPEDVLPPVPLPGSRGRQPGRHDVGRARRRLGQAPRARPAPGQALPREAPGGRLLAVRAHGRHPRRLLPFEGVALLPPDGRDESRQTDRQRQGVQRAQIAPLPIPDDDARGRPGHQPPVRRHVRLIRQRLEPAGRRPGHGARAPVRPNEDRPHLPPLRRRHGGGARAATIPEEALPVARRESRRGRRGGRGPGALVGDGSVIDGQVRRVRHFRSQRLRGAVGRGSRRHRRPREDGQRDGRRAEGEPAGRRGDVRSHGDVRRHADALRPADRRRAQERDRNLVGVARPRVG
mmetsp:Transcript_13643/g.42181  ORF Transcript_13643/g.42181 Transcript_13643/m.42181 type:complete len:508 (+) Transcript_13643:459-1982(+)